MIEAGKLRHRIIIEYPSYSQNSTTGAMTTTWTTLKNVWAAFDFLSAREFTASQSEQSKVVARVTIRHMNGIDATMRILFRGKYYNIEGVLPDKDSGIEYLTIPVSEGVRAA